MTPAGWTEMALEMAVRRPTLLRCWSMTVLRRLMASMEASRVASSVTPVASGLVRGMPRRVARLRIC